MKRKLVKQGTSTLMVSLPIKWIKNNNLGKGSEINIEEKNSAIIITGKERPKEKKEINITITENNKHDIKNILTHTYRKGYEKIRLTGLDKETHSSIREALDLLLGFEITDKNEDSCNLENISEPSHEKYEVMLKRIFLIIKETQNASTAEELENLRANQDKHILFCRRIINEEPSSKATLDWELLSALRQIEHKHYYLKKYLIERKIIPDKDIAPMLNKLKEMFELLYDAYFTRDVNKIHEITRVRNEYYFKKCINTIEKSSGKKSVIMSYIMELFRIISVAASPMMSMLLESSFELDSA